MSLSDEQVKSELAKMQAFIKKEAQEKSKEIRLKADEEYEIEKASIVRSETAAIDASYEQKLKKASLAQQITKSTIGNKTRLRILSTKEEVLTELFDGAEKELTKVTSDKSKYKPILSSLIEEGMLILLENDITVRVREQDVEVAGEAIEEAKNNYKEKTKCDVDIAISQDYLPKGCSGGVIVVNSSGKIEVNNTLQERLKLLSENALPAIRFELFGASETRKFFD
jgi:V-type H+-transporting ATPase subunit E